MIEHGNREHAALTAPDRREGPARDVIAVIAELGFTHDHLAVVQRNIGKDACRKRELFTGGFLEPLLAAGARGIPP